MRAVLGVVNPRAVVQPATTGAAAAGQEAAQSRPQQAAGSAGGQQQQAGWGSWLLQRVRSAAGGSSGAAHDSRGAEDATGGSAWLANASREDVAWLSFGVYKALERAGDTAGAWAALSAGNDLMRATVGYSVEQDAAALATLMSVFNGARRAAQGLGVGLVLGLGPGWQQQCVLLLGWAPALQRGCSGCCPPWQPCC
jgi:hypothetical protein